MNFIRKCFNNLDFCETWTNWIMQCITTIAFNMVVNQKQVILNEELVRAMLSLLILLYVLNI